MLDRDRATGKDTEDNAKVCETSNGKEEIFDEEKNEKN